jgi:hypothetical protein
MLKRLLVAHALFACFYGAILFAIVYFSAWRLLGNNLQNRPRQWDTHFFVAMAIDAVQEYQKAHGKLPAALNEKELADRLAYLNNFDPKFGPADAWGRPLHYTVKGEKFAIVSFGRDGRPGGVGLDADFGGPAAHGLFLISNMPNVGPLQPPTFEQFWSIRDSQEIAGNSVVMWATLCGVLVFGLTLSASWRLWVIGIRNLASSVIGRFVRLAPRDGADEQADEVLISRYARVFTVLDPHASLKARIARGFVLLAGTIVLILFSFVFAAFITLAHVRTGH